MKIAYSRVGEGAFPWLPLLRVSIRGPTGQVPVRMLVDSGAMETTVPEGILRHVGIEPTSEACELVGDIRYASRVIAVPDALSTVPILGHRDFFLHFWVGFDSTNRFFYVAPTRKR